MQTKVTAFAAGVAAAFALGTSVSHAAQAIPGLFNTGTDANNVALVGGDGLADPHYTILSSTSAGFAGLPARTYYNGAYVPNDATSRWISLTGSGTPANNTTIYRLSFDLAGLDHTTATISGSFGADNSGAVLLNGAETGFVVGGFGALANFQLTSGFVAGINTLDFRVVDVGVVTALMVRGLSGTAEALSPTQPIPEPGAWALMIAGFGLAGAALRRRRHPIAFAGDDA